MSVTDTSIKVPKKIRDRLQKRARRDHTTLAAALESALDEAEELEFWNRVREYNTSLTEAERDSYTQDHTLRDHLSEPGDTDLDEEDW